MDSCRKVDFRVNNNGENWNMVFHIIFCIFTLSFCLYAMHVFDFFHNFLLFSCKSSFHLFCFKCIVPDFSNFHVNFAHGNFFTINPPPHTVLVNSCDFLF